MRFHENVTKGKPMKRTQTALFGVPEYEPRWEVCYRPRISTKKMLRLLAMKRQTGKPVTQLVSEALDCYFEFMERG